MALNICQIALSVASGPSACLFYEDLFGLQLVFGTQAYRGPGAERVQGLPGSASHVRWLIDDRPFFQLEIFEFETPPPRPALHDLGLSHIGYNRLFMDVVSIDAFFDRVQEHGFEFQVEQSRSGAPFIIRDLDGIPIEIRENPKTAGPKDARLCGIGLSTPDLGAAASYLCDAFGFIRTDLETSRLEPGMTEGCVLRMGESFISLRQPETPILRPKDYKLNDHGIMNFAIGFENPVDFKKHFAKALEVGFRANCPPVGNEQSALCTYLNDPQGNSVEVLYVSPSLFGLFGFAPPTIEDQALNEKLEARAFVEQRQTLAAADKGARRSGN